MTQWLRQSTASQEIILGPFLDSTDGNTQETALTIANTDIKLYKHGSTTSTNKNSGGATHDANGRYSAVLDATDTNTLGNLEVHCHPSGALAVKREYLVVPAMVFDSVVLGTDTLQVDVTQFGGVANGSTGGLGTNIVRGGTAQAGAAGTITLDSGASSTDDFYNGQLIHIVSGTGAGQSRIISDYVGSTKVATVANNWATNPSSSSVFVIMPLPGVIAASTPTNFSSLSIDSNGRVDVIKLNGTSQTARDIGASVLVGDKTGFSLSSTQTFNLTGNITGNLSGSVGSVTGNVGGNVTGSVGSVTGNLGGNVVGSVGSVTSAVATTSNIKKNQSLSSFMFVMRDSTNHAPVTGKTVTMAISKDGGSFSNISGSVTEVANGWYKCSFTQTEMNANVVALKATATGCDDFGATVLTQP